MGVLDDYFSLDALAAEAGVSIRTVRRWVKVEVPGLPVTRLGRKPMVRKADFQRWLDGRSVQHNTRRS